MNGKYLLDTNIVIALFGKDKHILSKISHSNKIYNSSIVIGELYYGAYNSTKKNENIKKIDNFRIGTVILTPDEYIAKHYGVIKSQLKKSGCPIPENDIWISATAIYFDLTVATRDKHFDLIEGLNVENW